MARGKKIAITGIPGVGSTDFCARYAEASRDHLQVMNFNMGEILLAAAQETPHKPPIPAENLLNLHPEFLNALRDRIFDMTLETFENNRESYDRFLIDMHSQFFWNDIYTNAYDWRYLSLLHPDLFITLIEKPSTIKERQMLTAQGRLQDHNLRDLLLWQNIEVNTTAGLASNLGIPHYVLPGKQDPLTIESLFQSAFLAYLQMPMTDANSQADDRITEFKERVLEIGRQITGLPTPLIDPRTIDIESGEGLTLEEERAIRVQTVHRDLNWYIAEASDQIAYYPPGTTLSKGVSDESTRGFETGKNVFVVYQSAHTSPFMDIATKVFTSAEDFFTFFPAYMEKRIETLKRVI